MIHVYSQERERDLVVYLFINQLISFFFCLLVRGRGGGGVSALLPCHLLVHLYRCIYFCPYQNLQVLAI